MMPNAPAIHRQNALDEALWTLLLRHDCRDDSRQSLSDLIAQGVNPEATKMIGDQFYTPLRWCANQNQTTWIDPLLQAGARGNQPNAILWTPAMQAVLKGHLPFLRHLKHSLEHMGYPAQELLGQINIRGDTMMHIAANGYHREIIKQLISWGCDIDAKNSNGETPAFAAIYNVNILRIFIEAGADVNAQAANGETIAMRALTYIQTDALAYLIDQNANLLLKNKNGDHAIDVAKRFGGPGYLMCQAWHSRHAARLAIEEIRAQTPHSPS